MAVRIAITDTTTNNVTVFISGMNSYYRQKEIQVYIDGSYKYSETFTSDNGAEYSYTTRNILTSSTDYNIYIIIYYYNGVDYELDGQSNEISFRTKSDGGGGGGDTPTYTAIGSGNSIIINIINAESNCEVWTYLFDSPTSTSYIDSHHIYDDDEDSYAGLSNGTYYIEVDYKDANTGGWQTLTNDVTGQNRTEVPIGSGPTPSGDWYYAPLSAYVSNPSSVAVSYTFIQGQNGYEFVFTFDEPGELWVGSSYVSGSLISYWSTTDTGYNSETGRPYSVTDSSIGSFGYTYTGSQNQKFYLWVNSASDGYSYTLNVEFTPTPSIPTFTASVINNNQIQIFVQNRASDQYLRYFVRLESDENDHTYDTWRDVGRLVQDDTITVTNLLYNTWYRINVGYSNNPNSGEVNWIRSNDNPYLLQTGSQPISGSYVYIYTGSGANQGWKKAVPYIYTGPGANQGWKQAQAYIFNGTEWKRTIE